MPWPSGSRMPGKSFKLGLGSSPSRSFSVLVHHCIPLGTILYAKFDDFEPTRRRAREHMHACARHETECNQSSHQRLRKHIHIYVVRPLYGQRLRTHGKGRRASYLQSGRGHTSGWRIGKGRSFAPQAGTGIGDGIGEFSLRLSLSTVRGFTPGGC